MCLAERLGLDGSKAWRSFLGNGTTTGLLAQARFFSSTGVSLDAKCHAPESLNQRAWLTVWAGLGRASNHDDAKRLLQFYLASLSGTGTVERFVGCLGSLVQNGRRKMNDRSLEGCMKLLQQDIRGRRRARMCPKSLLSKPAPARAAGGGIVLHPATDYFLKCQKRYACWFGEKASDGRSLEVMGLADLAKNQVKASKPRLSLPKASSEHSEAMQLKKHRTSCEAAVDQLKSSNAAETILGTALPASESRKNLLGEMAEEAWQMRTRRKTGEEPAALPDISTSSASAPSAMAAMLASQPPKNGDADDMDWSEAVQAVKKQAQVAETRARAQAKAVAGRPAAFVDSKGGMMQVKPVEDKNAENDSQMKIPSLPLRPSVLLGPGLQRSDQLPLPSGCIFTQVPHKSDIVLVNSLTAAWESVEGLLARMDGARFQDLENRSVVFRGSLSKQHFVFFVTESFKAAHPEHLRVLEACATRSPQMKSAQAKGLVKRLELYDGTIRGFGKPLLWPGRTYELVAQVRKSESGSEKQLDLQQLLNMCGKCY